MYSFSRATIEALVTLLIEGVSKSLVDGNSERILPLN